jgi:PIN domain nuclease of toxin-antitoxin system
MIALDASALLAFVFMEPGHEQVEPQLRGAVISAVNWSEVLSRFARDGHPAADAAATLAPLAIRVVPFDEEAAQRAADLIPATRALGLSLGDRACLALAQAHGLPALTADHAWSRLQVGVDVRVIRTRKR